VNGERANIFLKRFLDNPMTVPLILSLVIHLALYASYKQIKNLNWKGQEKILQSLFPSSKHQMTFNPAQYLSEKLKFLNYSRTVAEQKNQTRPLNTEPPLLFVSVAPIQESQLPPQEAKYYSDRNSVAANPETKQDTGRPKIDGKQDKVMQTLDIPKPTKPQPKPQPEQPEEKPPVKPVEKKPETLKPAPQPLQPLPKQEPVEKQVAAKPEIKERIAHKPGDTGRKTPSEETVKSTNPSIASNTQIQGDQQPASQPSSRPLTLAEARLRQQHGAIAGEKFKQDGGVRRYNMVPSVDAKATPFGAYDSSVFYAIQQRWYDLLDNARYTGDRRGKVVIEFRLHYDGRISNLKIVESNVGEFLSTICRMAIEDPAPYEKWPPDMRKMVGADYREVTITFYYL
jgi:outer membrane biosynthesis protein TonB